MQTDTTKRGAIVTGTGTAKDANAKEKIVKEIAVIEIVVTEIVNGESVTGLRSVTETATDVDAVGHAIRIVTGIVTGRDGVTVTKMIVIEAIVNVATAATAKEEIETVTGTEREKTVTGTATVTGKSVTTTVIMSVTRNDLKKNQENTGSILTTIQCITTQTWKWWTRN